MKDTRHNYDLDNADDLGIVWPDNSSFESLQLKLQDLADKRNNGVVTNARCIYDDNRNTEMFFNVELNAFWTYRLG